MVRSYQPLPRHLAAALEFLSRLFLSRACGDSAMRRTVAVFTVCCLSSASSAAENRDSDLERGRQLFQEQCAACHGNEGQGVEDRYDDPLEGDYPQSHLLEIIEQTMPEEDPEACVDEDARDVAAFVYEQFYSEMGKLRRQAARIALSRLTVPQYRNSLTDLVQSFQPKSTPGGDTGGLKATYYKSRRIRDKDQVLERTDPTVDFDFEEGTPEPSDKFDAEEFAITWEGGLFVEQTGTYKLRLHSENGVKLWVNDMETALIDAWVRSGDQTEREESLFLLGGRTYPIKLHFFKNNDDRASISLQWVPPDGVQEPIPARHLARGSFPERFVAATVFPPDDRSLGYERGVSASKAWTEATTQGAIETANEVLRRLDELAGVDEDDSDAKRQAKVQQFCQQFVTRAFRRPLEKKQQTVFIDRHFEEENELDQAVKRVVILALKSPRFLYPDLDPSSDDNHAVASRLAYGLWDSPPDEVLLEAARDGELQTREQVTAQARRMLDDPRTRAKLRGFFHHWLQIDLAHDLAKDPEVYPDFDARLVADFRASLDQFIEEIIWGEASDFRQLLLDDTLLVNDRIAEFLEVEPPDADFVPVRLEETPRAGVLTHPYMMAALAHRHAGSPIHRGVFVVRSILGRGLRSPPEAIELLDEGIHPEMTMRERVELQTKPGSCQTCHAIINPLGFAFENYDGVGRFRTHEDSKPVDASGSYQSLHGELIEFTDARMLAEALSENIETHRSFVEQIFQHLTKQPIRAYGPDLLDELTEAFRESDFHVRELVVQAAATTAMGAHSNVHEPEE